MSDIQVIQGPMPDGALARPIYEVTLPSGAIVTAPTGFGDAPAAAPVELNPYIAEDGRVLIDPDRHQ